MSPSKADAWAKKYYSGKSSAVMNPQKTAELLAKASGRTHQIKTGVPALPVIHFNGSGYQNLEEFLVACDVAQRDGYGMATLLALQWCLIARRPLPAWLRGRVTEAISGWRDNTWSTLEAAFGARRPRSKQSSAHFMAMHAGQIYVDVQCASADGVAKSRELYEVIAKQYCSSAATVERITQAYSQKLRAKKTK